MVRQIYVRPPSKDEPASHRYTAPEGFKHAEEYVRPVDDVTVPTLPTVHVEPVEVVVVQMPRTPDRLINFQGSQLLVPAGKSTNVKRDSNRSKLQLVNTHATDVVMVIEKDGAVNTQNGYPLLAGKELTVLSTREVWLIVPGANNVIVGVYQEYVTELENG